MAIAGIDTKEVEKQLKEMQKALETKVTGAKAGYLSNDRGEKPYEEPNPPTMEEVALWNEFGTERIPARPFLSRALKSATARCDRLVQRRLEENADMERIAAEIGLVLQDEIKRQISHGDFAPNAEITIKGGWMRSPNGKPFYVKGKKSTRPLMHTGNLRQSVHWGIMTKSGELLGTVKKDGAGRKYATLEE